MMRFFSSFKKRSGRINRFRHTKEKKHNKKRKETFHMVCFVRGVFSFFIKLVCGPQKPLGEQKNHEKKTRALKKSRKREVKNSPEREKSAKSAQKKKGKKKAVRRDDATIEFFGDARADGRRNKQYRPKKEERRARRKKRRTFR